MSEALSLETIISQLDAPSTGKLPEGALREAQRRGVIDQLIADRSINEYVRWEAAQTYLHWVRNERWTREQAVQRLRLDLREAIRNGDDEAATGLVAELVAYSPLERSDPIVLASPMNFGTVTAVMKRLIERLTSHLE